MQAIYSSDLLSAKRTNLEKTSKPILFLILTLVLITISSLYYYSLLGQSIQYEPSPPPPSISHNIIIEQINSVNKAKECDIFRGEWIPNPNAPYYTNDTCWAIHENQNCIKFGRPDTEFMRWRWKPKDCDLPIFNPAQFLEIVRGKSLAFVGDSVGRNQMQSLMCLLNRGNPVLIKPDDICIVIHTSDPYSQVSTTNPEIGLDSMVTYAVDTSPTTDDKSKRWSYPTHNFTLANFWSPYLVKAQEADPRGPTLTGLFNLYLDEPDSNWTTQIEEFDYVIVSTGHWFFRPTMYYENNNLKGCHYCLQKNITDLTMYYGYRMAFRTTFRAINSLQKFKGMIFLRTFAPSHFENGEWNKGGNCIRTRPFKSNETRLDGVNLELYMTQLEEFWAAEREGMKRGLKFRLLDITEAIFLRPDGHPSKYGHLPGANVVMYNDCVHWCLPGPVDSWNDFLLNMLKMEGWRSASARLPQI